MFDFQFLTAARSLSCVHQYYTDNTLDVIKNAATQSFTHLLDPDNHHPEEAYNLVTYRYYLENKKGAIDSIHYLHDLGEQAQTETPSCLAHILSNGPKQIFEHAFAYGALMEAGLMKTAQDQGHTAFDTMDQISVAICGLNDRGYKLDEDFAEQTMMCLARYAMDQGAHFQQWRNSSPV